MMVVVMDKCEEQRMGVGSIRKPTVPHSGQQSLKGHARAEGTNHTASSAWTTPVAARARRVWGTSPRISPSCNPLCSKVMPYKPLTENTKHLWIFYFLKRISDGKITMK